MLLMWKATWIFLVEIGSFCCVKSWRSFFEKAIQSHTCKFGAKDGEWSCNCEVFVMNRLLDILMINNQNWSTPWHIWGRVADDFCGSMSSFDVHKVNLTVPFQTWKFSMFFGNHSGDVFPALILWAILEPLLGFYMGFCYPLIFLAVMVIPHSHKTLKLLVLKETDPKISTDHEWWQHS